MLNKIKQFILNRQFVIDSFNVLIEKVRGEERITAFKFAQKDLLEGFDKDVEDRAKELSKEKLSNLLSPVDLNKVVTVDKMKGFVFIGGEKIEEGRLASLKAEAEYFLSSDMWALLYETPKELAQRAMFVSGEGLADMQKGKSILYTLSSQKNILDVFKSYQQPKN